MPTNLFDDPYGGGQRVHQMGVGALGFDPSRMIQQMTPQIMQDVEERRKMGRGKYSQDILTQKLAQAAQELQNRMAGYDFSRRKAHDESFTDPEMQAMFKAYQLGGNMPYTGPIRSPEQLHDIETLQTGASSRDVEDRRVAAQVLTQPGLAQPGSAIHDWAKNILGI